MGGTSPGLLITSGLCPPTAAQNLVGGSVLAVATPRAKSSGVPGPGVLQ